MIAINPFYFKARPITSKEDDFKWHQAIKGPFVDKCTKKLRKIITLEAMRPSDMTKPKDNMNFINDT